MINSLKMGLILAVFCVIAASGLAYVYQFTQPRIESNARLTMENSKKEVLPASGKGRALAVTVRGYGGEIELLVGIDQQERISGLKVLSHKETPGLGANIVRPDFLGQFKGKKRTDPLEAKKDIDAISGATISSRAVCNGVKDALERFQSGNN
ncbi:MAG: FMN-binding protein [Candidatus Margulisbacteria bacterium]|jgi:electron transport complex protein RnfG|nr:FMN-binding protein [Candidatus Margulisiibacteriota bacterium]